MSIGFAGLLAANMGDLSGTPYSSPNSNALWLGHEWVDSDYSQAKLDALITRIRAGEFRDLFVHIGPLADDGSLNPALSPRAATLLAALHRMLPAARVQAWLGDVVGPDRLNLESPATRANIITSAQQALNLGFSGVHYDLEPVVSGDPGYLTVLAGIHALTKSRHALLSVAIDQIEPVPGLAGPEQWIAGRAHWWSEDFVHAVTTNVDEVAIMTYDTAVPTAAAYSGYVRLETILALRSIPSGVFVLIGLPAYHTDELGHTGAETVEAAIRGVRLAMRDQPRPIGAAFYADFSATPADWSAYQSAWIHPAT